MASFLEAVRKDTGARRYYVGGCRVTRGTFHALGTGAKSCLHTVDAGASWHHRHERYDARRVRFAVSRRARTGRQLARIRHAATLH